MQSAAPKVSSPQEPVSKAPVSKARRLLLISALYVSQAIPLGFFIVAMPAILRREGFGLESVGLLSGLAFPWLIKFLWAPLVDRYGSAKGHFRSWILPLQTLSVICVVVMSQLDLQTGMTALVLAGGLFMVCSATQDIATDGLAVRVLDEDQRGLANGVQVGGYYLGQILGGGLVLVFFALFGWQLAVLAMAVILVLSVLPVLSYPEPPRPAEASQGGVDFGALKRFVKRPGGYLWVLILCVFRAGEGMAVTMLNPMLVDAGLGLEFIGVTLGVVGAIAALSGALVGGIAVPKLGRKVALLGFGSIQTLALLAYVLPARGLTSAAWIVLAVSLPAFAGGLATAALYTSMMDRCDFRTPATDFTLQQSLAAVGPMIGAMSSGVLAAAVGYEMHFVLCAGLALLSLVLVAVFLNPRLAAPEERVSDGTFAQTSVAR